MNFRGNDPGAVQFGNFLNYYQFNSAAQRLELLPTHVWCETKLLQNDTSVYPEINTANKSEAQPYLVLDVGCNSGVLTNLLCEFLKDQVTRPVYILGVDIDGTLINRAKEIHSKNSNISFATVDVMNNEDFKYVENYLEKYEASKFDAVCCFSITMWIHLNHHDSGLQSFLKRMTALADLFVLEPQPWKCYQKAERRLKKADEEFPLFLKLKWRTDVEERIQDYLENDLGRCKIFECCPTKWNRRIYFYR